VNDIKTSVSWPNKNTFELNVIVPKEKIQEEYQRLLETFAKQLESHGFRKGKVPLKLAEDKIGREKIYHQLSHQILPAVYSEAVRQQNLQPIGQPKIDLVKAKDGEDWQIKITGYQKPKVELGNYKEQVKGVNAKNSIWTPEKGGEKESAAESQKAKEERFQKIISALLANVKIDLPEPVIEGEEKRKMAALIADLQKVGMNIDDYAQSQGKSIDQIRQEYHQQVSALIKLELILEAIADQENISVSQEEIANLTKNNPQANTYVLTQLLRQQKVLEYLSSL